MRQIELENATDDEILKYGQFLTSRYFYNKDNEDKLFYRTYMITGKAYPVIEKVNDLKKLFKEHNIDTFAIKD